MTGPTIAVRGADWLVAWDPAAGGHRYLRDGDFVFRDDAILQVGGRFEGTVDQEIVGTGLMVMPGLVNIHCHPTSEPGNKGLLEELGSPGLGQSSLYEFMPVFSLDPSGADAASDVAMSELLQSGVTTVVDLSGARSGWIDSLAATGLRAYIAPMFRSASWRTPDGHSVDYQWDEAAGLASLERAVALVERARQHPSGRMDGMLAPSQVDTCSPELLRRAAEAGEANGMLVQLHAAQSMVEFNEMIRRHGQTPIAWLDGLGLLGPNMIISHAIFLNDHPWLHWPHARDFDCLVERGVAVAHCPTVFARRGIALNTLGRYAEAGIRIGIGTDTFPLNMIDELRQACYAGRILAGDYRAVSTAQAFDAATLGGASILRRDDIGRLAPGAKADFSLVELGHPYMQPVRDPLRSLIYSASDRAIRDVYVGGEQVVENGRPIRIDVDQALAALTAAQAKTLADAPERDWAGRSAEAMSPLVYPADR